MSSVYSSLFRHTYLDFILQIIIRRTENFSHISSTKDTNPLDLKYERNFTKPLNLFLYYWL